MQDERLRKLLHVEVGGYEIPEPFERGKDYPFSEICHLLTEEEVVAYRFAIDDIMSRLILWKIVDKSNRKIEDCFHSSISASIQRNHCTEYGSLHS